MRIVKNDISQYTKDVEVIDFVKCALRTAVNISELEEIWNWFKYLCTILLNKALTNDVLNAKKKIFGSESNKFVIYEYIELQTPKTSNQSRSIYKQSPFYVKAMEILEEIKSIVSINIPVDVVNSYYNETFLNIILTKYMPYIPLWTNVMGKFVDDFDTKISNSPAEGYFAITKNITLDKRQNIRVSEYVRLSHQYILAKIKDIELNYLRKETDDICKPRDANVNMPEETWKKTPSREKNKLNIVVTQGEKFIQKEYDERFYSSRKMPQHIRSIKFFIGRYDHV